jgi:hypothetical protein
MINLLVRLPLTDKIHHTVRIVCAVREVTTLFAT